MKRIHSLDFMQAKPTPWLGWAAAGIGLIVLAATALPLWPLAQDNQARASALRDSSRQIQDVRDDGIEENEGRICDGFRRDESFR